MVFSDFVVAARDVLFYVTAGHILRDIRKSLNLGGKFDIWRLGDQTARSPFGNIGMSLPLKNVFLNRV